MAKTTAQKKVKTRPKPNRTAVQAQKRATTVTGARRLDRVRMPSPPPKVARAESGPAEDPNSGKYVYCIIKTRIPLGFGPLGIGAEPAVTHTVTSGLAAVGFEYADGGPDPTRTRPRHHRSTNRHAAAHVIRCRSARLRPTTTSSAAAIGLYGSSTPTKMRTSSSSAQVCGPALNLRNRRRTRHPPPEVKISSQSSTYLRACRTAADSTRRCKRGPSAMRRDLPACSTCPSRRAPTSRSATDDHDAAFLCPRC